MRRASRPIPFQCASLWLTVLLMAMPSLAAPEPCSLLTTAEVEQVVGTLKGAPKADNEGAASWCNYEFANGKDLMEVWVFPAEAIERGRKVSKKPVVIKGLGDEAFMDRGMHGINYVNLFVKKGGTTVKLSIQETHGDEEKLKALAKKALNRF
jgi:hypothetical protein